jgi:RNA polymerase sigma-70 factor (ECF subfamily)
MVEGLDRELRVLMRRAQGGDGAAYRELLAALTPVIRGVIYKQRSFLSKEDREDLVQDVLLSLHSVRATYDPDRPFVPWLMAILRRRLADRARQDAKRGKVLEVAEEFHETFPATLANNTDTSIGDEDALREAVSALPAGQRQAIELVKLQELSLKEASEKSGASVASLKVSVHRAVKMLRQQLKKTDDE